MIRKSGYQFFRKDHAPTKIWSAMMIQLKAIALRLNQLKESTTTGLALMVSKDVRGFPR
jgi:hypothetical protein